MSFAAVSSIKFSSIFLIIRNIVYKITIPIKGPHKSALHPDQTLTGEASHILEQEKAMKTKHVKDLMVPISDYATVHEDASMAEAIRAIENVKKRYGDAPYRHQSLVVIDSNQHVVGRLSQVDMMHALEPGYSKIDESSWIGRSGLSRKMLAEIREQYQLWEQPVEVMCQGICKSRVKDFMQKPTEGEFVSETDTLNIAAHRIVMGRHHSLLVTRDSVIVGVLRSTDLFNALYDMLQACECK